MSPERKELREWRCTAYALLILLNAALESLRPGMRYEIEDDGKLRLASRGRSDER